MKKLGLIISAVLGALVAIFIIQNWAPVSISFLFWSFEIPRLVLVSFLLLVGFVLGLVFSALVIHHK